MYTIVPFRNHREMTSPMDSLFNDRFFRSVFDMNDMVGSAGFRVDVKELADSYHLEAELPGVKQEDIAITVDNDVLSIAADLNVDKHVEKESYLYSERRSGHMERRFNLEGICQDNITASYKDGVLTVTLPKSTPATPAPVRRIAIESK